MVKGSGGWRKGIDKAEREAEVAVLGILVGTRRLEGGGEGSNGSMKPDFSVESV